MISVSQPLLSSFILAATMIAAGVTSIFFQPGKTVRTLILHFAGGMVFAVVAVELWPFVRDQHVSLNEAIEFVIGVAILLGLRRLTHNAIWMDVQSSSDIPLPRNVLVETGENIVVGGLVIGVAFAAETRAGVLLTVALAVEALSLGIAAACRSSKSSSFMRITLIFFLGSCYVVASGIGSISFRHLSDNGVTIALSLSSVALLFLAAEEILIEAREIRRTPTRAAAFFGGYFVLLLLDSVVSGLF